MEEASVLRVLSPVRLVLGLAGGAVVCAVLERPMALYDFQAIRTATALAPARGWARLGAYNPRERHFEDSDFVLDPSCWEGQTTEYERLVPEY
jgi:hypothetical protein